MNTNNTKHIHTQQISEPDHGYNTKSDDIRETAEFENFKEAVYQYIKVEKNVTWRMLITEFKPRFSWIADIHYWVTMAVDMLDGKKVTVEKHKIPERIVLRGK